MSKHEQADLILKLYDLRREEKMREARSWFFTEFQPRSLADFDNAIFGPHRSRFFMVMSYWDMAAALVNHGAISRDMFNDTNGEHFGIFAIVEPILAEAREAHGAHLFANLERLVDATPGGRERTVEIRERFSKMRAQAAGR